MAAKSYREYHHAWSAAPEASARRAIPGGRTQASRPSAKGGEDSGPWAPALRRLFARYPDAGVGVLLGPAGGVVDLETDEPEAATGELRRIFLAGVPETMGWRSARGEHRLFAWDDRLAVTVRTAVASLGDGALELRLGARGKQVASVCPPSAASGGVPRAWNGC